MRRRPPISPAGATRATARPPAQHSLLPSPRQRGIRHRIAHECLHRHAHRQAHLMAHRRTHLISSHHISLPLLTLRLLPAHLITLRYTLLLHPAPVVDHTPPYQRYVHQYFPKSLKDLEVCVDGRFCLGDSTLSFSLSLLPLVTSELYVLLRDMFKIDSPLFHKTYQLCIPRQTAREPYPSPSRSRGPIRQTIPN